MHEDIEHDDAIPLPAPRVVAERCMSRAWDDDINDDDRLLMEQAADMIRGLMARCVSLAAASERREARRARR